MTAIRAFTKTLMDDVLKSISEKPRPQQDILLVSSYSHAVFVVADTAIREVWNWRRTKREMRRIGLKRKGVRREYHKRTTPDSPTKSAT